jgi:hypothetical protein
MSSRLPEEERYESVRSEPGKTTIFRSDNSTDFLRNIVEGWIEEHQVQDNVTATVEDMDGGYVRITLKFKELDDDLNGIWSTVDSSVNGKGWYHCRKWDSSKDGLQTWWEVKHKDGAPWG